MSNKTVLQDLEAKITEKASIYNKYTSLNNSLREEYERKKVEYTNAIKKLELDYVKKLSDIENVGENSDQRLDEILLSFEEKEEFLISYERQLDALAADLSLAKEDIDTKEKELSAIEENLKDTIIKVIQIRNNQIKSSKKTLEQQFKYIEDRVGMLDAREAKIKDLERSIKSAKIELKLNNNNDG